MARNTRKEDRIILTSANYPSNPGTGGGGSLPTLNDIINEINTAPGAFYVNTTIKSLVAADITAALNNWISSSSNPFVVDIAAMKAQIATLQNTTVSLSTELQTLKQTFNVYVGTTDSKIQVINNNISSINDTITKIVNGVDLNVVNLKTLNTRLTSTESQIQNLSTNLSTFITNINPKITTIETDIASLKNKTTQLDALVTDNTTSINNLQTDLQNKINGLTTRVTTNENNILAITTDVEQLKVAINKYASFFNDDTTGLTIKSIFDSLNTLNTSIANINNTLLTYGNLLTTLETRLNTVDLWITDANTKFQTLDSLVTKVDSIEDSVDDIITNIGGSIVAGYMKHDFVTATIVDNDNLKPDGSNWIGTSALTVGSATTYNTILPVLIKRINEVLALSGPSDSRFANIENSITELKTRLKVVEDSLVIVNTEIAKIQPLSDKIDEIEKEIPDLKSKTKNLNLAGDLPSDNLIMDQTLSESFNNSSSGTTYIGSQVVKPLDADPEIDIEDILSAFYYRIDDILTKVVNIDTTQIEQDIVEIKKDIEDFRKDYDTFSESVNDKFLNFSEVDVHNSFSELSLNEYDTGKEYSNPLKFSEATDNTLKQHLRILNDRIFELKRFIVHFEENQILDTKVDVSVDRTLFNNNPLTGEEISNSDEKYIDTVTNLQKCLNAIKMYINETTKLVEKYKNEHFIAIGITPMGDTDPDYNVNSPFTVDIKGRMNVFNKSIFEKLATFKENIVVDGNIYANKLYITGKELAVVRKIIPDTLVDGAFSVYNNMSNNNGFHYADIAPSLGSLVPVTATFATSPTANKTSYVVESLDHITVYANYSLRLEISNTMTASNVVMLNLFVNDMISNTRLAVDQYISLIQGAVSGKPFGLKYHIMENASVSNQAISAASLADSQVSWGSTTSMSDVRLLVTPTNYTGPFTGSTTPSYTNSVQVPHSSSQLVINNTNVANSTFYVSTERLTLGIYSKPAYPFFVNVGVKLVFEKMNF